MGAQWNHVAVEVSSALLEHHRLGRHVFGRGEEIDVPVEAFIVVLSIVELHLLERLGTGMVGDDRWVHREEGVKGGGARLLRSYHQKLGQLLA